jgi:hypothetical protein
MRVSTGRSLAKIIDKAWLNPLLGTVPRCFDLG